MGGSGLVVPSAARRRALMFTGTAAGMAATGTAAAAAAGVTSVFKGVAIYVCLGAVGGGALSLAVSEAFSRAEPRIEATQASVAKPVAPAQGAALVPTVAEAVASAAPVTVAPGATEDEPSERAAAAASKRSTVSSTSSSKRPPAPSLFEEQRSIESARAALVRGDAGAALAALDGYQRDYAQGQFGPEALALRVEALSKRGDLARARSLSDEFRQRYPHHPLLSRVQAAVQH
jgi:hypothetical protein